MRSFFSAFDSFFFKAFDFLGRSSRSEYWSVMIVLWVAMAGLIWWDARGFLATLDAGDSPSLNPFAYGSVIFILVTAIPRFTLAIRRLQDSGRKAKWATLPYTAFLLGVGAVVGVATSGALVVETGFAAEPIPLMLFFDFSSTDGIARTIHAVLGNLDKIHFVGQIPSGSDLAASVGNDAMGGPAATLPMILMALVMLLFPPLAMLIYTLFMSMPSEEGENAYGLPSNFDHGPKATAKGEHNAFASYAILTRQDRPPTEAELAARKETVHSLYEQRVLGRQRS